MTIPRIVVVGTSAGGFGALGRLVAQFPEDFPAAVFIVQHMAPAVTGEALLRALGKAGRLPCSHAQDGERFKAGHIYVAPPDQHMLLAKGQRIHTTKGAAENRYRPAIDPLFRSAAVAYGHRVLGVILTGFLDDGTSGMIAIKRCGGTTIVQDPADAAYPEMPTSAIENADADHVVPLSEMGSLLTQLAGRPLGRRVKVPPDIVTEARIAERVLSDLASVRKLGDQVPFNCPGCGGVLWEIAASSFRYRCHTGHAYTSSSLLVEQTTKIEETLWIALRMFEERRNLLMTMATAKGPNANAVRAERAEESMVHIRRIRAMLTSGDKGAADPDRQGSEGHAPPARSRRKRARPAGRRKAGRAILAG